MVEELVCTQGSSLDLSPLIVCGISRWHFFDKMPGSPHDFKQGDAKDKSFRFGELFEGATPEHLMNNITTYVYELFGSGGTVTQDEDDKVIDIVTPLGHHVSYHYNFDWYMMFETESQ